MTDPPTIYLIQVYGWGWATSPGQIPSWGHVIRADRLEKDFMLGMVSGTRSSGSLRRRWLDEIREATNLDLGS